MSGWLMNAKHIPSTFGRDIECDEPLAVAQRNACRPGTPSRSMTFRDMARIWDFARSLLRRKSTSVAAW